MQGDLRGASDIGTRDLVELAELRALEGRVDDALHAEGDIIRRQLRAVLEADVAAQVEDERLVVRVVPGRGDLRHDLASVIAGDEIVEDVAIDAVAIRIPLQMRIEGRGVAAEIDGEFLLLREARARMQRSVEGEGQYGAAHALSLCAVTSADLTSADLAARRGRMQYLPAEPST